MNGNAPAMTFDAVKSQAMVWGWGMADQAVVSATNLLTSVVLARLCSQEEFGAYIVAFSVITVGISLNQAVLISPLTVFLPRRGAGKERDQFIASAGALQLTLTVASCLLCGGLAAGLSATGHGGLAGTLLATVPALFGVLSKEYVRRLLLAQMRFRQALVPDVLAMVLQLSALAAQARLGELETRSALLTVGAAQVLAAAAGWMLFLPKSGAFNLDAARGLLKGHWRMGGTLAVSVGLTLLATQTYPWFLHFAAGAGAAAIFGACLSLVNVANPISHALSAILGPQTAHAYAEEGFSGLARVNRAGTWALFGILGPIGLAVCVLSGPLLHLLYGAQYAGQGPIVTMLVLFMLANIAGIPLGHSLITLGCTRQYALSGLAAAILTCTAGVVLTSKFGVMGAACGVAFATAAGTGLRYLYYTRAEGVSGRD